MKNKLSSIMVVVTILAVCNVVPAMAFPTASLKVLDTDIVPGETFGVEVWVDGDGIGEELLAFGFDVSTEVGSSFSYDGYVIESGFDDESFGPNNVAGSIIPGFVGDDVLIATLSFTGLSAGMGGLSIVGFHDGFFSGLYYESGGFDISGAIDISVSTDSIPEPATLLLFGTGLAGLLGLGRKKSVKEIGQ